MPGDIKLIKIRNPWGKGEWKGHWSDNSMRWNDNICEQVNYNPKGSDGEAANDGIFWMDLSDFRRFFGTLNVLYINNPQNNNNNNCYTNSITVEMSEKQTGYIWFSIQSDNTNNNNDNQTLDIESVNVSAFHIGEANEDGILENGKQWRLCVWDIANSVPVGGCSADQFGFLGANMLSTGFMDNQTQLYENENDNDKQVKVDWKSNTEYLIMIQFKTELKDKKSKIVVAVDCVLPHDNDENEEKGNHANQENINCQIEMDCYSSEDAKVLNVPFSDPNHVDRYGLCEKCSTPLGWDFSIKDGTWLHPTCRDESFQLKIVSPSRDKK